MSKGGLKNKSPLRNINLIKNLGQYRLTKSIKGKTNYYGQFNNIEEAIIMRDIEELCDWKYKLHVNNYNPKHPFIQKIGQSYHIYYRNEYFGCYDKLEDAEAERDICIKCNWDWNKIVEYDWRVE